MLNGIWQGAAAVCSAVLRLWTVDMSLTLHTFYQSKEPQTSRDPPARAARRRRPRRLACVDLLSFASRPRERDYPDSNDFAASLLAIVGVGPKMAYLYLQATGKNVRRLRLQSSRWHDLTRASLRCDGFRAVKARHRRRHARAPHYEPPAVAQEGDANGRADAVRSSIALGPSHVRLC